MIENLGLPKIGAWLSSLAPAVIGSLISLRFSPDNSTPFQRLTTFLIGVSLSYFIGGAILEHFGIDYKSFTADAIKLTIGLFGMAITTQLMIQIPEILSSVRKKFIGE